MIKLSDIYLSFNDNKLIDKGNIVIPSGTVTLLRGESGCGKSTLLMSIGLLSHQVHMDYYFDNIFINEANEKTLSSIRQNEISFIFQDTYLFNHLSLIENIQFYASLSNHDIDESYIREQLDFVGLDLDFHTSITTMSCGEKQRLAIVCGILKDARLFIFDEPTSFLDDENKQIIISILMQLAHEKNKMVLIASHDGELIDIADQIYTFHQRNIICDKSITYQNEDAKLKHNPLNMRTLYQYVYHKNIIFSIIVGLILGVILACFTVSFIYTQFYGKEDEKDILKQIHHEIYLMKSDESMLSAVDQVNLKQYFEKYDLYPNADFYSNIEWKDNILEGVQIQPYFAHSIDDSDILKVYQDKTFKSVYATYEVYHYFRNDFNSYIKLEDQQLQISGILKAGYNSNRILYVPYDYFKSLFLREGIELETIPVKGMIVDISSLDDYQYIINHMPSDYRFETFIQIESQVNLLFFFQSTYLTIIWVIALLILIIYKTYKIIDDKKNTALLKTFGVDLSQLIKMRFLEEGMLLIPISIISIGLSYVSIYFLKIDTMSILIAGEIIIINLLIIFIVNLVIYYIFILKYSAATLMRNE